MKLMTVQYVSQAKQWPQRGRHILAHYDDETIVVYQAFRPSIGIFAAKNKVFGGDDYKFDRMSWIKPNFLWMMYRSGWGTKPGQEIILAVHLRRSSFEDNILNHAIHSSFVSKIHEDEVAWRAALKQSSVRLQWDPDHDPSGQKVDRRAMQLGLRGATLRKYAQEWIVDVEDISAFVREQRGHARSQYRDLFVPAERVYPIEDAALSRRLQLE